MNEKLTRFIQERLRSGFKKRSIRKVLIDQGNRPEVVDQHIAAVVEGAHHPVMQRRHSILSTLVAIAIILFSLTIVLWFFLVPEETPTPEREMTVEEARSLLNEALIAGNATRCQLIDVVTVRQECERSFGPKEVECDAQCKNKEFFNKALIEKDVGLCSHIQDETLRNNCVQAVEVRGDAE